MERPLKKKKKHPCTNTPLTFYTLHMLPAGKPFLTQVVFCVKIPLLLHDKAATTKHQGTMLTRLFTHLYAPPHPTHLADVCSHHQALKELTTGILGRAVLDLYHCVCAHSSEFGF